MRCAERVHAFAPAANRNYHGYRGENSVPRVSNWNEIVVLRRAVAREAPASVGRTVEEVSTAPKLSLVVGAPSRSGLRRRERAREGRG